jgi:hypothetical protein
MAHQRSDWAQAADNVKNATTKFTALNSYVTPLSVKNCDLQIVEQRHPVTLGYLWPNPDGLDVDKFANAVL